MKLKLLAVVGLASAAPLLALGLNAQAQNKTIRIGVLYDLSGPLAGGGSVASSLGAHIAIDMVNEKGGILGKYKIVAVPGDA